MKNTIIEQFKGFLATSPLWEAGGPFNIEQFILPPFSPPHPQEKVILSAIPSLRNNFVLGKRMESFFSYLIRTSPQYHIVAENVQIKRDKITIGEIDFIVEAKGGDQLLHVEMVYKFYVYDPSFKNEEERWIGPNRRDSLIRKIKKLKEHQFPLIYEEETSQTLKTLNIESKEFKQQACFKASLFVPRDALNKAFPIINNSCICGYWIHLEQFIPGEFSQNIFFAPKKPDWPIDPASNEEWYPFSEIYQKVVDLHSRHISPLLWMKLQTGKVERIFVVWW